MATISNVSQFSPTQVSGCSLWLDAADPNGNGSIPASGSALTTWVDKSGNGKNATASSSSTYILDNQNRNTIYLNNQGFSITSFVLSPTSRISVFCVLNHLTTSTTANMDFIGTPNSYSNFTMSIFNTTNNYLIYVNSGGAIASTGYTTINRITLYELVYDGNSGTPFVNGSNFTSFTRSPGSALTISQPIGFCGGPATNTYYYEAIMFNTNLTSTQRQQIEGYLAWKWNLQASLPTTHPFYTNPFVRSVPITPIVLPFAERTNYSLVPTQISGCALWLDAADANSVVTTGSNVTQWNDKSGNVRHMSNATLASTPTYNRIGFNNLPTISFSPTIFNFLQNTSFNLNSLPSITLFIIVQRISNTTTFQRFFSAATTIGGADQSGTTAFNLNTSAGNDGVLYERNGVYTTKATFSTLNPCMIELIINGSSTNIDSFVANTNYIYTNGSLGTSSTGSANGNNFNLVHVRLGNAAGNNSLNAFEQLQGNISEVVMFNRALNLNQFRQIEGYLAWKWNLQASLPSTHPFFKNPFIANLSITTPIANVYRITNRGFNPPTLPGMSLWLDAADPFNNGTQPSSGTTISTWNDKSGSGNNATPVSAAPQLVRNVQNGLAGILFSAAGTMKCGAFLTSTNFSIFSVSNISNGPSVGIWKVQYSSFAIINSTQIVTGVNKTGGYLPNTVTVTAIARVSAVTLSSSTTAGSAFTMNASVNGTNTLITGTSANGNANTCAQEVAIGGLIENGGIAGTATGYINEVIIFNVELTTTQRQQVEGYLAWKWGLQKSLPTNHPFYLFPPG